MTDPTPRFRRACCLSLALAATSVAPAPAQLWDAGDLFLSVPDVPEDPEFLEFGYSLVSCDWNGDGRPDLAVGAPEYDGERGAVFFYEIGEGGVPTLAGAVSPAGASRFGEALACGDFDGADGGEVAVGAPNYELDGIEEGRVLIFDYAVFPGGILQIAEFRQSLAGVSGAAEDFDAFGSSLAVGDFNFDGADDLAVGSPGEAVGAIAGAGAVTFFYGIEGSGLDVDGNANWHKDTAGVTGSPAAGEEVGFALTAFDANCDNFADLAIGVPGQTIDGIAQAGAVYIVTGSATGIVAATSNVLDTTDFPQPGAIPPGTEDRFGQTLASAGSYFGETCGALAIGAPRREVHGQDIAGAIYLLRHTFGVSRYYSAADFGGSPDFADFFGATVAFADFDADGRDDLAVGIPGNDLLSSDLTGGVFVALSAGDEPDPANATLIFPRPTLEYFVPASDNGELGSALAAADFNGDGHADLAIGLPTADYGEIARLGGVELLYGALFSADFEGGTDNEWDSTVP